MNDTLVLYKTQTGASKKYAEWLALELHAPLKEYEDVDDDELCKAETLYILSGTYGGQMPLVKYLKENWQTLESKKIVAIAVGMSPENHWWSRVSYFLVPGKIKKAVEFHKLLGWMPKEEKTMGAVQKKNLDKVLSAKL